MFKVDDNGITSDGSGKANETCINLSKNNKFQKLMHVLNIGAEREPSFLTFNAKKVFNYLQLAFIIALIRLHLNLESHIRIETNRSSYTISRVLSYLNFDFDIQSNDFNKSNFSQWYPIA